MFLGNPYTIFVLMEELTIPSSAKRLGVSEEAINQHIRAKRKLDERKHTFFYITIKKQRLRVKVIDGVSFILFTPSQTYKQK